MLGDVISSAVSNDVSGAVRCAISDAVSGAVRCAVSDAVDDAVDSAVSDVNNAVRDAVRICKKLNLSIKWHYWLGGQFWVGWEGFWLGISSCDFLMNFCGLKLSKDITERAEAYRKVCESVNYIWPNRNFVIVCARPTKINRDQAGRLHSLIEKSIEYPDGWGLYHIHGVQFEEDLWKRWLIKSFLVKIFY